MVGDLGAGGQFVEREQVLRLGRRERQVGRTQLERQALGAQACQGEARFSAAADAELRPGRQVLHEDPERLPRRLVTHEMDVVDDEHERRRGRQRGGQYRQDQPLHGER